MRRSVGGIIPPTLDELKRIATEYGFELTEEEARFHAGVIEGTLGSYRRVGELPEPKPEVRYRGRRVARPTRPRTRSTRGTGAAR